MTKLVASGLISKIESRTEAVGYSHELSLEKCGHRHLVCKDRGTAIENRRSRRWGIRSLLVSINEASARAVVPRSGANNHPLDSLRIGGTRIYPPGRNYERCLPPSCYLIFTLGGTLGIQSIDGEFNPEAAPAEAALPCNNASLASLIPEAMSCSKSRCGMVDTDAAS
jgi:hypothetical protein